MTLNFQNRIVFPAPQTSYTSDTAYGQVIYIPRNILSWPKLNTQTQAAKPKVNEEPIYPTVLKAVSSSPTKSDNKNIGQMMRQERSKQIEGKMPQDEHSSEGSADEDDETERNSLQLRDTIRMSCHEPQFEVNCFTVKELKEESENIMTTEIFNEMNGSQIPSQLPQIAQPGLLHLKNEGLHVPKSPKKENSSLSYQQHSRHQSAMKASLHGPKAIAEETKDHQNILANQTQLYEDYITHEDEDFLEPVCDEQKTAIFINSQAVGYKRFQPGDLLMSSEMLSINSTYRQGPVPQLTIQRSGKQKATPQDGLGPGIHPDIQKQFASVNIKEERIEEQSGSMDIQEEAAIDDRNCIPCLYLPYENGAEKLVIYFHGNAEDIGLAYDLLYRFGTEMQMHVLAVEYPGYGLYKMSGPCERQIKEDSEIVYQYLTKHVGVKDSDIILFGRSMGSGPATHLSSLFPAYSLLLMSPYTSIKDVARSLLGKLSFLLVPLVHERFRNIDTIKKAKCPAFLLHGVDDKLIPPSHSQELFNNCPTVSYLQLAQDMDHNEFDFMNDLIRPFLDFIKRLEDAQTLQDVSILSAKASQNTTRGAANEVEKENFITIYSDIDESCVDYQRETKTFDIYFDSKLYEPPQVVIDWEQRQIEEQKEKIRKNKNY